LPLPIGAAYGFLFRAAVATLPNRIREIVGVPSLPGDLEVGRPAVSALRWALGPSPDWQLALLRTGAPLPADVGFRQPPRQRTSSRPSITAK
jgi:hypothetical protein